MTEVDGRGRSISTAILYDVVMALRDVGPGDEITLLTDRLTAVDSDVRAWCRETGNELVTCEQGNGGRSYLIRKTGAPRTQPPWALVISDPGLEELLSPLGFSLGAALAGSRVAIYFQGPAARVPTRGFRERLKGIHRAPFSGLARRGLAAAGHPPPREKLRQLRELGAQLYVCGPSMEHFKVREEDLAFDDIRVAAYPTFVEEMTAAGVQFFVQ